MPSERSDVIWLSLSERPPPRAQFGRKCWVHLRLSDGSARIGYLDADGNPRLRGEDSTQLALELVDVTAWRPISAEDVEAYEQNA